MSFLYNQESCPRLLDYLVIVGSKHRCPRKQVQPPKLLRRYPPTNHSDFQLPLDVVYFCQPDGCSTNYNKRLCHQETTSFVFTLTEKDSGVVRFGTCLNFYRPIDNHFANDVTVSTKSGLADRNLQFRGTKRSQKSTGANGTHSLTSICIISHYPFFSKFRQCLYILKNIIEKTHVRANKSLDSNSTVDHRYENSVWSLLLGIILPRSLPGNSQVLGQVREIESWILRLLSAPAPEPGKKCLNLTVLPESVQDPLIFALPDKTRLSLVDFPLHLPLELLGIDTCLKLLTAIILEHKVVVQSRDYNALTMAVMAFTALLYPLQYMFPVIPLLPTCMMDAEQLLLAPTPYLIGLPATFLQYKRGFQLPSDVWLIDLDSNKLVSSATAEPLPSLPEPERSELVHHLQQAMASIHSAPPINNLDQFDDSGLILPPSHTCNTGSGMMMSGGGTVSGGTTPALIFGNDVDSVDVATRVAMVKFFNSPNMLANFTEHTRTLRLYPRPVVMFQHLSFLRSRQSMTAFTKRLARTQAVEYLAEWSLCPENEVFQRIHAGIFDPAVIGDKPKWYSATLPRQDFLVCRPPGQCTLHVNWNVSVDQTDSDDASDIENGSSGAEEELIDNISTLSSYSSYSDFADSGVSSDTINNRTASDDNSYNFSSNKNATTDSVSEFDKLTVRLEDVLSIPVASEKGTEEMALLSSSEDNDVDDMSSSDQNKSAAVTAAASSGVKPSPIRPPPPTKIGSIGSHPGTPVGAPKSAEQLAFFPENFSKDEKNLIKTKSSMKNGQPDQDSRSNASSDSDITGLELLKDIGEQMSGAASQAGHTINDILGSKGLSVSKLTKPYTHLAPKKSLIEKSFLSQQAYSSLGKHNQIVPGTLENKRMLERKNQKLLIQEQMRNNAQSTENQAYLKEVVSNVLKGNTPNVFNRSKVNKLLEDENYRNFVLSKLYVCLEHKVSENQPHVEDVCINHKSVFKAIQWLLGIIIQGLEVACKNRGNIGGMASAFLLLEIMHTHYLSPLPVQSSSSSRSYGGSQSNLSQVSTPDGNDMTTTTTTALVKQEDNIVHTVNSEGDPSNAGDTLLRPMVRDKPQMLQLPQPHNLPATTDTVEPPLGPPTTHEDDLLRNLVLGKSTKLGKMVSVDSDHSDMVGASTSSVISNSRITHEAIRPQALRSEASSSLIMKEASTGYSTGGTVEEVVGSLRPKCKWSGRYRYHCNRLLPVDRNITDQQHVPSPANSIQSTLLSPPRTYLFEMFVNDLEKLRHSVWANLQFWEDVFLDTVAQERDMVGMDQATVEMMKRYAGLSGAERRRLQLDEDRLLATLLYNLTAFMLMMRMDVGDIRHKIRRVLASCHLGLHYSQQMSYLLDNLNLLQANDIDLKPLVSRLMQRKSFTVHWGTEPSGDILFFEVFDDCIILRSISGAIVDRWWFEKIIHFSFCPKTKVVVFWMKNGAKIAHNKLYTKKCKELYNCVKETLEKAASRAMESSHPPPEMGGEFSIRDRTTNEGGSIQVCMEGLSISFPSRQHFIPISQIRRCLTQRGDTFIIEMMDPTTKKIKMKKYYSEHASNITYTVLCLFSYLAASLNVGPTNASTPSPSRSPSMCSDLEKVTSYQSDLPIVPSSSINNKNSSTTLHTSQSANSLTY